MPPAAEPSTTTVYTDGACSGNPGPGGWAWIVPDGAYASGAHERTTNQRMELAAALDAVRSLDGPLHIVSDSKYVVDCFRQGWWKGWLARGWKNSKREPVANRDLWEPLLAEVRGRDVSFEWVKGHGDDPYNDLADKLAVDAGRNARGRSGDRLPDDVAGQLTADSPRGAERERSGASAGPSSEGNGGPSVVGYVIAVGGARPPDLGGYGPNPLADNARSRLADILRAKAELHPDVVVATGLGLGAEQLGAEAARDAGVPYVAVLAFPDPEARWPRASKEHFARLRDGAKEVLTLRRRPPGNPKEAGAALGRRDQWLADNAAEAILVVPAGDHNLARLVRRFEDAVGDDVWVLEPEA